MRYRKFLPLLLLALALAAPAAAQRGRGPQGVPPGHLPPAGMCRVWYDGRPPGHQPGPTDCATARQEAARTGGRVIFGDDREDGMDDDDWWNDDDQWMTRFDRLDLNDDGFLARSEWPAEVRLFDLLDRNRDNRLSRSEIQNPDFDRDELMEERFRANDRNRDGRLSLTEWWGRDDRFELLDRNEDGFVSRSEFLSRQNVDRDDLTEERFRANDRNRDGRLSLAEWWGRDDKFELLDRNEDGFVSRSEFLDRRSVDRDDVTEERFRENDLNRDGRLSSREWWGNDEMFELLDRNGDDYLSLTEALERNPEDYRLSTRRFHELDRNRDGRLTEREWSGSLTEFNRRDRNDDGFLSLDEWLRRS